MDFGLPSPRIMMPPRSHTPPERSHAHVAPSSLWPYVGDDDGVHVADGRLHPHHQRRHRRHGRESEDDRPCCGPQREWPDRNEGGHDVDRDGASDSDDGRRDDRKDDRRTAARRRRAPAVASLLPTCAPRMPRPSRASAVTTTTTTTTMAIARQSMATATMVDGAHGDALYAPPSPAPYGDGMLWGSPHWAPSAPPESIVPPSSFGVGPMYHPAPFGAHSMLPPSWPVMSPTAGMTAPPNDAPQWGADTPDMSVSAASYRGSWQPQSYAPYLAQSAAVPAVAPPMQPAMQPPAQPMAAPPTTTMSPAQEPPALGATSTFVVGQPRPSLTLLRSSPSVNAQYQRLLAVNSARLIDEVRPPANFDGRKQWNGLLSPVLDQGQCGGCWAFSSAGVLGDRFAIHTKGAFGLALSPEHLILCGFSKPLAVGNVSRAARATIEAEIATLQADLSQAQQLNATFQGKVACYGNTLPLVCEYLYRYGTRSLRCDPYTLGNIQPGQGLPSCRSLFPTVPPYERCKTEDRIDRIYRAIGRYFVSSDEGAGTNLTGQGLQAQIQAIKAEVYKFGPIMAGYEVFRDFMQPGPTNPSWATGIYRYDGVSEKDGGHAIVIVGWGTDPDSGETFWIIRNSWGVAWGEAGYFRMYAGQCGIEHNTMAVIPDLPGLNVPAEYVERFIVDEDSVTVRALVDVDPSGLPASYVRGLTPAQRAAEAQPIVAPDALPEYGSFMAGRIDNPRAIPGAEAPLPVGATRFVTPTALSAALSGAATDAMTAAAAAGNGMVVPLSGHTTAPSVPVTMVQPAASSPGAPASLGAVGPGASSWPPQGVAQPDPAYSYTQAQTTQATMAGPPAGYNGVPAPAPWPMEGPPDGAGTSSVAYFGVAQQQASTTATTVDYGAPPRHQHGAERPQGGCGCAPGPSVPLAPMPAPDCGPCLGGAGPFPMINALMLAEACAGHVTPAPDPCLPDTGTAPAGSIHGVDYRADGCGRQDTGVGCTYDTAHHHHADGLSCTCAACQTVAARPRARGRKTQDIAAAAAYILVPLPETRPSKSTRKTRRRGGNGAVAKRRPTPINDVETHSSSASTTTTASRSSSGSSSSEDDDDGSVSYNPSAFSLAPSSPSSIRLDAMSGDLTSGSRHSASDSGSDSDSASQEARARRRSRRHRRVRRVPSGRRR
ncbi:Papain-like cysteine peptidase [Pandoravirus salinus]|uniref:Papain-like cysteine peptidase n=1 Tax=Pandoravirus salinus TaxID=1349410 RepID=S4W3Y7_9VIRU|nr:Peptidase domain containing protein [Pandoravirus salinus]AGO85005.1 Papain-like cysteine peptidase [Pandoravirus salinus]